jgi:hypothetical protein
MTATPNGAINYIATFSGYKLTLGKMRSFSDKKQTSIMPVPFPGQDAGKSEGIDTSGVVGLFVASGRMVGQFNTLQDNIYLIKNIADGLQTSSSILYSPLVNCKDYNGTKRQGIISVTTDVSYIQPKSVVDSNASFLTKGIRAGDVVKNLNTGYTTTVASVASATMLVLDDNIFSMAGESYAVTANINVKIISFEAVWELPGLSYVDYNLSVMQVK